MQKTCLIFVSCLIVASCGNSEKQETRNKDSIPGADTSTAIDSTQTGTEFSEDFQVTQQKSWQNTRNDIPDVYAANVEEMVSASTRKPDGMEMSYTMDYLMADDLSKLNTHELIYYCLTYPASYSQNCNIDMYQDSTGTPKIKRFLNHDYDEMRKSQIQNDALNEKRDSVILLLNKFITKHPKETDAFYLSTLIDLNAIESIPVLVQTASLENLQNFTVLVFLMDKGGYEPFKKTDIYDQLFGEHSGAYGSRTEATTGNMNLIKELALKFYNEKK